MIVISGALVLVALVLLLVGLLQPDLGFVYASIAGSLLSFVALFLGLRQRRRDLPDNDAGTVSDAGTLSATGTPSDTGTLSATGTPSATGADVLSAAAVPTDGEAVTDAGTPELAPGSVGPKRGGGSVLVVPGRPRYHAARCRYLTGKDATAMDLLVARADGFTPCGVCKPDQALAQTELLTGPPAAPTIASPAGPIMTPPAVPTRTPAPAPIAAPTMTPGDVPADGTGEPPYPGPLPRTERVVPPEAHVSLIQPIPATAGGPATGAGEPFESRPAAGPDLVMAVPAGGRFHTPNCRYVDDASRAQQLTRAEAVAAGYHSCGVCKP